MDWSARRTTLGEFTALLHGSCAGVKRVTLGPLSVVYGAVVFDFLGSGREDFLKNFVGGPPSPLKRLHKGEIKGPQLAENGSARDGTRVQTDGHAGGHHRASGVPEEVTNEGLARDR